MMKPKRMAERLVVSVRTLQRWDNDGTLKAHRTPKNRRYYTEDQYLTYIKADKTSGKNMWLTPEYLMPDKKMT